jgi:hypothetical protein
MIHSVGHCFGARALVVVTLAVLGATAALAASPEEMKKHAFATVHRNAAQMALVGDSLYYFAELGMQEFESTTPRWADEDVTFARALQKSVGAKEVGLEKLTSSDLRRKASAQFEQDTKETKYFSLLPAEAKPPLDLNRETMEKFRGEMRKHYLNQKVQFR